MSQSAAGDGMARGAGGGVSDARAAVAPSSPLRARLSPAGPLSFWEVVPELPDWVVSVEYFPQLAGADGTASKVVILDTLANVSVA